MGGAPANDVDLNAFILRRTPYAIGFVLIVTYVVLFQMLRSVLLPLKAVVMNLLSISASFGALIWIFEEGHLASLLRFVLATFGGSDTVGFAPTLQESLDQVFAGDAGAETGEEPGEPTEEPTVEPTSEPSLGTIVGESLPIPALPPLPWLSFACPEIGLRMVSPTPYPSQCPPYGS